MNAWFSVEPGTNTADVSKSPLIVSARFDTPEGRVGSLDVRAEIIDESSNVRPVALYDVGSVGNIEYFSVSSGALYCKAYFWLKALIQQRTVSTQVYLSRREMASTPLTSWPAKVPKDTCKTKL